MRGSLFYRPFGRAWLAVDRTGGPLQFRVYVEPEVAPSPTPLHATSNRDGLGLRGGESVREFGGRLGPCNGMCSQPTRSAATFSTKGAVANSSAIPVLYQIHLAVPVTSDPPYSMRYPTLHLSDFFSSSDACFEISTLRSSSTEVPKKDEIVVDRPHQLSSPRRMRRFTKMHLHLHLVENGGSLRDDGISTVVFASKTTASREAVLGALINAGWVMTSLGQSTLKWKRGWVRTGEVGFVHSFGVLSTKL